MEDRTENAERRRANRIKRRNAACETQGFPSPSALIAALIVSVFLGMGAYFIHVDHTPPLPLTLSPKHQSAPVFAPAPSYPEGLIDINTADLKTLDTLPGIGETLASRIIESRPYFYLEDLLHVRGVGDKRLQDIRALIAIYGKDDEDPALDTGEQPVR